MKYFISSYPFVRSFSILAGKNTVSLLFTLSSIARKDETLLFVHFFRARRWSVHPRTSFAAFTTLSASGKSIGIARYQVDATQFDAAALKTGRKRTDAAERMKNAHEAAAYKGWLTQQVQEAIDDPRPSVPHEQVAAEWATERAALVKRAENMGN